MKFFATASLFCFLSSCSLAQDTTHLAAAADTLPARKVQFTPYYDQPTRYATSYVKVVDDRSFLLPVVGTSIFNSLRGQVPNLAMPAYFSAAMYAGMRVPNVPLTPGGSATWLVDGVPFNNGISSFLNTNAFEYSSIAVTGSANATSFLQAGTAGAFVLTSKLGEGHVKPLFQFNSFVTNGWLEGATRAGSVRDNDWLLSHSFSYAQDFGAIDTRVSYNLATRNVDRNPEFPDQHSIKVNTGLNLSKRFSARLIWDGRLAGISSQSEANFFGNPIVTAEIEKQIFHQANLTLRYQVLPWLKITSQVVLAQRDSSYERKLNTQFQDGSVRDDRKMANAFVTLDRQLGKSFQLSAFAGGQRTWQERSEHATYQDGINNLDDKQTFTGDIAHFSFGATLTYARFLTLSWSQRLGKQTLADEPEVSAQDYAAGLSFIFSELWKPKFIDFGKLRFNVGEFLRGAPYSTVVELGYPWLSYRNAFPQGRYYPTKDFEGGLDIIAFRGRLTLSGNLFRISENYLPTSSSPAITYLKKGWEVDARAELLERKNVSYTLGIILGTVADRAEQNGTILTPDILLDPDVRQGILNVINIGDFQASVLVEALKVVSFVETTSSTKVRDVTLGYRLPKNLVKRVLLKDVFISASGRNLYTIDSKGSDVESFFSPLSGFQKSISMNLLISF
jgi:hypothetical protein